MKEVLFTITENRPLAPQVYALRLCGDTSAITAPGQFLELQLPGFFLRRPISVCDFGGGTLTLVYKIVGEGTAALARARQDPRAAPLFRRPRWRRRDGRGRARLFR